MIPYEVLVELLNEGNINQEEFEEALKENGLTLEEVQKKDNKKGIL